MEVLLKFALLFCSMQQENKLERHLAGAKQSAKAAVCGRNVHIGMDDFCWSNIFFLI